MKNTAKLDAHFPEAVDKVLLLKLLGLCCRVPSSSPHHPIRRGAYAPDGMSVYRVRRQRDELSVLDGVVGRTEVGSHPNGTLQTIKVEI